MIATSIFTKQPNWKNSVYLRYKWNTTIHRGLNGKENRNAYFSWPRRSLQYTVQFNNSKERIELQNQIYFNVNSVWAIPIWMNPIEGFIYTYTDLYPVQIPIYEQFLPGQPVIIFNNADTSQYIVKTIETIETVSGIGYRQFDSNWVYDWPSTTMYPLIQGLIDSTIRFDNETHTVGSITINITEKYDEDDSKFQARPYTYEKFGRFPVLDTRPNWIEKVKSNVNLQRDLMEYTGAFHVKTRQEEPDLVLEMRYDFKGRENIANFENFFNTMKGRKGRFWIPTHLRDFDVDGSLSGGASSLTLEDYSTFDNTWENQESVGSHIYIDKDDENDSKNRVSSAGATSLSLSNPLGISVNSNLIEKVGQSFLVPSRFDLDEIEMEYLSQEFATCKIKTRSLNDPDFGLTTISTTTTTTTTTTITITTTTTV